MRRARTPSNSSGLDHRIVGMRLDVGRQCRYRLDPDPQSRIWCQNRSSAHLCHYIVHCNGRRKCGRATTRGRSMVTLADIEAARRTIAGHVLRTPLLPRRRCRRSPAPRSSSNTRICRSPIRSRSAAPASSSPRSTATSAAAASSPCRPAITPRRWPITPAVSASPATIVMPVTTPFVKVKATEALGATVVLDGETVAEAQARAEAIAAERQSRLGPPVRRSANHRRAGDDRARNARRSARSRRAGGADRRRRADRRLRHRRARHKAVDRDRRRRDARSIRRCGTRSTAATGHAAARRSPKASRSRMSAS